MTTTTTLIIILVFWFSTFFWAFLGDRLFGKSRSHLHISFIVHFIAYFICYKVFFVDRMEKEESIADETITTFEPVDGSDINDTIQADIDTLSKHP